MSFLSCYGGYNVAHYLECKLFIMEILSSSVFLNHIRSGKNNFDPLGLETHVSHMVNDISRELCKQNLLKGVWIVFLKFFV
jgi:hypothetical protein